MCGGHDEHVLRRDHDVLGEGPGPGDADAGVVVAELAPAALAVATVAARDVALAGDPLADLEPDDVGAELLDLAHELVADHHRDRNRRLRPRVPVVDVQVGSADRRLADPDQHVAVAGLGLGDVLEPQAGFGSRLHQRLHDEHAHRRVRRATNASIAWSMSSSDVRGRHLRADARLALGHDREREGDHVDPLVEQALGHLDGDACIAEHHGDDRMPGSGQRESGLVHAGPEALRRCARAGVAARRPTPAGRARAIVAEAMTGRQGCWRTGTDANVAATSR